MIFYLISFSCPTKTKSFRMRARFHLMMQNETGLILGTNLSFFFFKENFGTDMRNFRISVRSGPEGSLYCSH